MPAIQLTQSRFHASRVTFYICLAGALLSFYVDFGAAQKGASNFLDVMSGEFDAEFTRAFEPMEFQFPRDHGPHPHYRIEWWYYTGNLQTDGGKDFGYQLTFFRFALTPKIPERLSNFSTNQMYMAHFALTDASHGEFHSFERVSRGACGLAGATGEPTYSVWLEDWSARETDLCAVRLSAVDDQTDPRTAIHLTLRETRSAVLHGNNGLSQKGPEPGNANYYYSLVGLSTTGSVTINGKKEAVSGVSWMDHEFGTSALAAGVVGWDWFSLQLDSGAAMMLYCFRRSDQSCDPRTFEGTLAYPDGRQVAIRPGDFTLTATGNWTSPETGITYPSGWRVALSKLKCQLHIEPLIPNQEFHTQFTYWEGAVQVEGQIGDAPVSGWGYTELTGYE